MAFEPFNYGEVLRTGEAVKSAQAARDPNSPKNRLLDLQIQGAEKALNTPDPERLGKEAEAGYMIFSRMAADPSYIPTGVDEGKRLGLFAPEFSIEGRNIMELQETAGQRAREFGQILSNVARAKKPPGDFSLAPGATRYSGAGDQIATAPPKSDVKSAEREAQDIRIAAKRGPLVRMGAGEKAEDVESAKLDARFYNGLLDKADEADTTIAQVRQMQSIDVDTGALEPAKARLAAIAEGFGLNASGLANATNAQAFNAISNRLVNQVLNLAKGPQTEGDAQRARSTIASLGNTPEARRFVENTMLAAAYRTREMADYIAERRDDGERIRDARMAWRKYTRTTQNQSDHRKGPDGLPLFFFQFKENARAKRPGISDQEIIDIWVEEHAGQ